PQAVAHIVHRLLAEVQYLRDLVVGVSRGGEAEDLSLSLAEDVVGVRQLAPAVPADVGVHQQGHDRRVDVVLAPAQAADGVDDLRRLRVPGQVAVRPRPHTTWAG